VVTGAVGGCGASTLAGALSLALVRAGAGATLLELDVERGDLAGRYELPSERTLADLVPVLDELDARHLEQVVFRHESGVRLLLARPGPGAAAPWTAEATARLLDTTACSGPVVVDAGAAFGPRADAALARATTALVAAPLTLAGARGAARVAAMPGRSAAPLRLIASPVPAGGELSSRALASSVGLPVAAVLPSSTSCAADLGGGRWPRRSRLARRVEALVEELGA